jgi:hypothetical protein
MAEGKISLTSDIWDDKSIRAYIGVTAHYIVRVKLSASRSELVLRASLIGFLPIPGKHRGQDIAKSLVYVTDRAKITDKVHIIPSSSR